jgi:hypothetical protein
VHNKARERVEKSPVFKVEAEVSGLYAMFPNTCPIQIWPQSQSPPQEVEYIPTPGLIDSRSLPGNGAFPQLTDFDRESLTSLSPSTLQNGDKRMHQIGIELCPSAAIELG